MKAKAVKINDKEWIAEVDCGTEEGTLMGDIDLYKTYPITSSSDRTWLQKNTMDGKEMEIDEVDGVMRIIIDGRTMMDFEELDRVLEGTGLVNTASPNYLINEALRNESSYFKPWPEDPAIKLTRK